LYIARRPCWEAGCRKREKKTRGYVAVAGEETQEEGNNSLEDLFFFVSDIEQND
jgi:hypothetical protein